VLLFLQYTLSYKVLHNQLRLICYSWALTGNTCVGAHKVLFACRKIHVSLLTDHTAYKEAFRGKIFYYHIIFKCLLEFFNPVSSFIAVTKLNVLDLIFFYAIPDLQCLRGEGTVPVYRPAIAPTAPCPQGSSHRCWAILNSLQSHYCGVE
jgi:hypothetical protein